MDFNVSHQTRKEKPYPAEENVMLNLAWPVVLSQKDRDVIILKGPLPYSLEQRDYPRDSKKRIFPLNVFHQSLPNKKPVERDFLVWSSTNKALYCFPCPLLDSKAVFKSGKSSLLCWNGGLGISGRNS